MAAVHVYEDTWGEVIDHPEADFLEIRWYDSTSAMSKDEFQRWLNAVRGARGAAASSRLPHRRDQLSHGPCQLGRRVA